MYCQDITKIAPSPSQGTPGKWPTMPGLMALLDAFELDDETANPQPEYGDFWAEMASGESLI
ncbi:MAG: hypothetical protein V3V75_07500 [Thermoguttaceae bacterium]